MVDFERLRARAEGRWASVFYGLFEFKGQPNSSGWIQCKSPFRDERHPSFSFNVNNGWAKDFSTGESWSGLDVVSLLLGMRNKVEAAKYVLDKLGDVSPIKNDKSASRTDWVKRIWNEASPIQKGDGVWDYLTNRKISESLISKLQCRLAKAQKVTENGECIGVYDAMVFRFVKYVQSNQIDADGVISGTAFRPEWSGVHLTYLHDGKKAPVSAAKKTISISDLIGSVIPLVVGDPTRLTLGEGIETTLAYEQIEQSGSTLVAAGTASLMMGFRVTDNLMERVKRFYVLGDLDRSYAGQASAFACARNIVSRGKEAEVLFPNGDLPYFHSSKGMDWADLL